MCAEGVLGNPSLWILKTGDQERDDVVDVRFDQGNDEIGEGKPGAWLSGLVALALAPGTAAVPAQEPAKIKIGNLGSKGPLRG